MKGFSVDETQQKWLNTFYDWISNTWTKDSYVTINGRMRTIGEYLETLNKIRIVGFYTHQERDMLNELRTRYIKKDLNVEQFPF